MTESPDIRVGPVRQFYDRSRIPEHLKRMAVEGTKSHTIKLEYNYKSGPGRSLSSYTITLSSNSTPEMNELFDAAVMKAAQKPDRAKDVFVRLVADMREVCRKQHYRLAVRFYIDGEQVKL